MSKMYENYLELKKKSKKYLYLFECGNFYIFLADDAEKVSDKLGFKLTFFANGVKKCGFPKNSLDKYMEMFKSNKLKIKIIEKANDLTLKKVDNSSEVIKRIKSLNLNELTPLESFEILKNLKEMIDD